MKKLICLLLALTVLLAAGLAETAESPAADGSGTQEEMPGEELTDDIFKALLAKNKHISCVLFYGGEWVLPRLLELISIAKSKNLKVCLYTGLMLEEVRQTKNQLLEVLDYIKVGRWIEELGGLNKKTTNQRLYRIKDGQLEDITNVFYKE